MRRKIAIIQNPAAGRDSGALVDAVEKHLLNAGSEVTRKLTQAPGDALHFCRALAKEGIDLIVAAGGDGTIREVAAGLQGTGLPLGVIPAGTANVLARDLGLVRSWRRPDPFLIATALLHGPERTIRLAVANGRPMAMMAGVGYDGAVCAYADPALKKRAGRLAYVMAGLRALTLPLPVLRVEANGSLYEGCWFIASLCRHYAGPFELAGDIVSGAPLLHGFLLEGRSRFRLMLALAALPFGLFHRVPGMRRFSASRVRIAPGTPAAVEIDGDAMPGLLPGFPLEIGIVSSPVRIVAVA